MSKGVVDDDDDEAAVFVVVLVVVFDGENKPFEGSGDVAREINGDDDSLLALPADEIPTGAPAVILAAAVDKCEAEPKALLLEDFHLRLTGLPGSPFVSDGVTAAALSLTKPRFKGRTFFLVSFATKWIIFRPIKGNKLAKRIFCRVDQPMSNALIAGPMTNPKPNVAMIRPKYFGRSICVEESATVLCTTGINPPKLPEMIRADAKPIKVSACDKKR